METQNQPKKRGRPANQIFIDPFECPVAPTPTFIETLFKTGIPCHYARFHQPVPGMRDKEPVSEFNTKLKDNKYSVDSLSYTAMGLIFKVRGETNIVPLANIIYVRT